MSDSGMKLNIVGRDYKPVSVNDEAVGQVLTYAVPRVNEVLIIKDMKFRVLELQYNIIPLSEVVANATGMLEEASESTFDKDMGEVMELLVDLTHDEDVLAVETVTVIVEPRA